MKVSDIKKWGWKNGWYINPDNGNRVILGDRVILGGGVILGEHEYEYFDDKWEMVYAWYFQAEVKLFEQLIVTPEVGQYTFAKERGFIYWGLNSLIEF